MRGNVEHWTQIMQEPVNRAFKEVRDELSIFKKVSMNERPTFHQIRALDIKIMKDADHNPRHLAEHSTE